MSFFLNRQIRLVVLVACLAVLVIQILAGQDFLGLGTGASQTPTTGEWAAGCPARAAPPVALVTPRYLISLRGEVRSVMFRRRGTLYEIGAVSSEDAWSDGPPQKGVTLLPDDARVHGAYEMRWWALNRDDIVADAFVFSKVSEARDFFNRASSPRCRPAGEQLAAPLPANARDLVWLNPDNAFQEDVYFLRGHRVYRVADVSPQHNGIRPRGTRQKAAFAIVNDLACALPGAGCRISKLWLRRSP